MEGAWGCNLKGGAFPMSICRKEVVERGQGERKKCFKRAYPRKGLGWEGKGNVGLRPEGKEPKPCRRNKGKLHTKGENPLCRVGPSMVRGKGGESGKEKVGPGREDGKNSPAGQERGKDSRKKRTTRMCPRRKTLRTRRGDGTLTKGNDSPHLLFPEGGKKNARRTLSRRGDGISRRKPLIFLGELKGPRKRGKSGMSLTGGEKEVKRNSRGE